MKTPTITPVQIIAAIGAVIGLLVTNGLVTNDTGKLVTGLASTIVPLAFVAGDALIRHGRSRALTPLSNTSPPPPGSSA